MRSYELLDLTRSQETHTCHAGFVHFSLCRFPEGYTRCNWTLKLTIGNQRGSKLVIGHSSRRFKFLTTSCCSWIIHSVMFINVIICIRSIIVFLKIHKCYATCMRHLLLLLILLFRVITKNVIVILVQCSLFCTEQTLLTRYGKTGKRFVIFSKLTKDQCVITI